MREFAQMEGNGKINIPCNEQWRTIAEKTLVPRRRGKIFTGVMVTGTGKLDY
jgi:uncharacterized membrane protein YcaP (DUF421 family)